MNSSPRTDLPPVAKRQPTALQAIETCPADEILSPPLRVTEVPGENWQITHIPGGNSVITRKDLRCPHGWHTQEGFLDASIHLEDPHSGPVKRNRNWKILPEIAWEPFKPRILELHITRGIPLTKVRRMMEIECGFLSEVLHYRTRVRKWKQEVEKQPDETAVGVTQQRKRKHDYVESGPQEFVPMPSQALSTSLLDDTESTIQDSLTLQPALAASDIDSPQSIEFAEYNSPYIPGITPNINYGIPQSSHISRGLSAPEPEAQSPSYLREVEERLRRRLAEAENSFTGRFSDIEVWLVKIIDVLMEQGRYKAAETTTLRLFNGRGHEYGYGHTKTIQAEELLGETLYNQGLYNEAEKLHCRTRQQFREKLGFDDPITIKNLENLALALVGQDEYTMAATWLQQALQGRERIAGKHDETTLKTLLNLATVSRLQERHEEAEILYRRAIGRYKVFFEDWFPGALRANRNLASLLAEQGEFEEAESIFRKGVEVSLERHGINHPETLSQIYDFAMASWKQGRTIEAESMVRQVLKEREILLGTDHHDTIDTVSSLVSILKAQERFPEARVLLERTYEDRERVLGANHTDTLDSMEGGSDLLGKWLANLDKINRRPARY